MKLITTTIREPTKPMKNSQVAMLMAVLASAITGVL